MSCVDREIILQPVDRDGETWMEEAKKLSLSTKLHQSSHILIQIKERTMSYSLVPYNNNAVQIVSPDPTADGGLALNSNFKALSTKIAASTDPTSSDDYTDGFRNGSRWFNGTTKAE